MSDALNYLMKTRSKAMTSYFKFFKEVGHHLDIRTRDLISVITKVDARTENGFRQYLLRALHNGATPNEIIDALLMALPTLGLTKIIWAIDILLDMNIPEFTPDRLNAEPRWHDVCAFDEVTVGEVLFKEVEERHLYIYRNDKDFRVYDSLCPHQATDIPPSALKNNKLTCPKHKWVFDIATGACITKGDRPLRRFDVKKKNNRILALW